MLGGWVLKTTAERVEAAAKVRNTTKSHMISELIEREWGEPPLATKRKAKGK